MTYTVNDKCIMCKHTDCVTVCPVDCFYEGENMLVINPDECIDCGVCEPECPEDAILPDTDDEGAKWIEFNGKWSKEWAVLTEKKDPMPDHEKHSGEQGRLEKYFKDKSCRTKRNQSGKLKEKNKQVRIHNSIPRYTNWVVRDMDSK